MILPAAPANFYSPSLLELKNKMESVNGSTKGQIVLITTLPADIEAAWAEVGVGGDTLDGANRGSFVVGNADIGTVTGPLDGPEEVAGEPGQKLTFGAISNIPVYIDGSGTTIKTVIGLALVEGIDAFGAGTGALVRYFLAAGNLVVTDGGLINTPAFDILINYSEENI